MSDTNFWDVLKILVEKWNIWATLIIVLAGLLVFGFINAHNITEWINAGVKAVPKL